MFSIKNISLVNCRLLRPWSCRRPIGLSALVCRKKLAGGADLCCYIIYLQLFFWSHLFWSVSFTGKLSSSTNLFIKQKLPKEKRHTINTYYRKKYWWSTGRCGSMGQWKKGRNRFASPNEQFRKEFLQNLSHEFKTPIFAIQGYVDTLLHGALENPEGQQAVPGKGSHQCRKAHQPAYRPGWNIKAWERRASVYKTEFCDPGVSEGNIWKYFHHGGTQKYSVSH